MKEKYKSLIKQVNIDGFKHLIELDFKDNKTEEAIEKANFILGKGYYLGKKAKPWNKEAIDKFIETCKPKSVSVETKAEDTDLHKK